MSAPGGAAECWLSAHLYFEGQLYGCEGDRVISAVVEPFVEGARQAAWISRFFFVRFGEDGPHIRLRLRGSREALEDAVRPGLMNHVRTAWPWPGQNGASAGRLQWTRYEPELARYGGEGAIDLAEACFESSSRLAFVMTRKLDADVRASRLGKGLLAMLVLVHAFTPDRGRAALFARLYRSRYLRALAREEGRDVPWREAFDAGYERQAGMLRDVTSEVWDRLAAGEPLLSELDAFRADLTSVREGLERRCAAGRVRTHEEARSSFEQAVSWIAPSFVHMMNNRVGVNLAEETYLAHLIARSLQDPPRLLTQWS